MANQKPVDEIRIGRVKATIWRNGTDEQPRHNVTFSRLYKDGDQWKSTQSFGHNDLLVLAKVADLAHSRIFSLPQEEETETRGRFLAAADLGRGGAGSSPRSDPSTRRMNRSYQLYDADGLRTRVCISSATTRHPRSASSGPSRKTRSKTWRTANRLRFRARRSKIPG